MSDPLLGQGQQPSALPSPSPVKTPPNPERWKGSVIVLIMINTILVAMVAGLQTDANIRASTANRDSQYYAVLASGELQRQGLQGNYDMTTYSGILDNTQRSLVMQFTALQQEQGGDTSGAAISTWQGRVAQAQVDTAKKFSIFYQDPRYAPGNPDDAPHLQSYISDSTAQANALVAEQNQASDTYRNWSGKSDSYVAVLTILAIAFFLFGIAQSVKPNLRLLFAGFGIMVMTLGVGWALAVLVG